MIFSDMASVFFVGKHGVGLAAVVGESPSSFLEYIASALSLSYTQLTGAVVLRAQHRAHSTFL